MYKLYYWPNIQGRGEFIRLALEEASAVYLDVARDQGVEALLAMWEAEDAARPPFAPPFLAHGKRLIAQTAKHTAVLGRPTWVGAEGGGRSSLDASAPAHHR
jgi:glutathione S-transferase